MKRWPERTFWSWIDIGIIERAQGRYREALAALDHLTPEVGETGGMPYRYHRGWTLTELGRYREAVDEFTKGIAEQSDYQWAYARRACANAGLGDLRAAVADQHKAVELLQEIDAQSPVTPQVTFDEQRAKAVEAQLNEALSKRGRVSAKQLCDGYWPDESARRGRSRLVATLWF